MYNVFKVKAEILRLQRIWPYTGVKFFNYSAKGIFRGTWVARNSLKYCWHSEKKRKKNRQIDVLLSGNHKCIIKYPDKIEPGKTRGKLQKQKTERIWNGNSLLLCLPCLSARFLLWFISSTMAPVSERHTISITTTSVLTKERKTTTRKLEEPQPATASEIQPTTSSSASSGPCKRRRATRGPVVEEDSQDKDTQAAPAGPTPAPDARQCLLALPQIVATRIPGPDSIGKLSEFVRQNEALPPRVSELS